MKRSFIPLLIVMTMISCHEPTTSQNNTPEKGTFAYDQQFLSKHDSIVVLQQGNAKIIVSPKYQAKVFTSTAAGDSGRSFGWVNYKAFDATPNEHMNAYGGENRLWLGPEGGKFSLFFPPGSKMEFASWKTPPAYDNEPWDVLSKSADSIVLQKDMHLLNYAGTKLNANIRRSITILDNNGITKTLGLTPDPTIAVVGYTTHNTITNTGDTAWTETTGAPCIWLLDMFNPTPETIIVVPFDSTPGDHFEKTVTSDYFGAIPADRLKHADSVLFLKADGKSRGKLGIRSTKSKPAAGSYDYKNHILTITIFDTDHNAKYLNQEWSTSKPPFLGDAVNAYNDGPLADGTQMGPFFELESVSPAAFLKPNTSLTHTHSVFHFSGAPRALDAIAQQLLGASLATISETFTK
jgi:hypothetical protein